MKRGSAYTHQGHEGEAREGVMTRQDTSLRLLIGRSQGTLRPEPLQGYPWLSSSLRSRLTRADLSSRPYQKASSVDRFSVMYCTIFCQLTGLKGERSVAVSMAGVALRDTESRVPAGVVTLSRGSSLACPRTAT